MWPVSLFLLPISSFAHFNMNKAGSILSDGSLDADNIEQMFYFLEIDITCPNNLHQAHKYVIELETTSDDDEVTTGDDDEEVDEKDKFVAMMMTAYKKVLVHVAPEKEEQELLKAKILKALQDMEHSTKLHSAHLHSTELHSAHLHSTELHSTHLHLTFRGVN